MSARTLRIASSAVAGLIVAGALGACEFDRATVLSPLGDPSYDFRLTADGRNVPRGTYRYVRAHDAGHFPAIDTTLTLTLRGLEELTSGIYKVWIGNVNPAAPADTGWQEILGDLTITRIDTSFTPEGDPIPDTVVVRSAASASTFTEGGPATQMHFNVNRTTRGGAITLNTVLVSIEASDAATAPSTVRPLWVRVNEGAISRTIIPGTPPETTTVIIPAVPPDTVTHVRTGNVKFGNYALTIANEYLFTATGRGTAGIRGNILIVDDSALARPPIGYYYATWVVRNDVDGNPVDTLMLGEQTAPFPDRDVSLREADVSLVHPVVLDFPMSILAASNRIELSGADPFLNFGALWVTLENKAGFEETAAPTIVLSGIVPEIVSAP